VESPPLHAGQTPKSLKAFTNSRNLRGAPGGQYSIEVIDLLKNPKLASGDQILAIPTLVRKLPEPIRKIIGDLSNTEKVLIVWTCVLAHSKCRKGDIE